MKLNETYTKVAVRTFFCDVVGKELEVYKWLQNFEQDNCPYTVWEPLTDLSYGELLKAIDSLVWDLLEVAILQKLLNEDNYDKK